MNKSNFEHLFFAAILQIVLAILFKNWLAATLLPLGILLGREMAQNQIKLAFRYRNPGAKIPYNSNDVKWYKAFHSWSLDSLLDIIIPTIGLILIYFTVNYLWLMV